MVANTIKSEKIIASQILTFRASKKHGHEVGRRGVLKEDAIKDGMSV